MEQRIAWDNLPGSLKAAIAARTGPITAARAVIAGQNSPLAVVIDTAGGQVFARDCRPATAGSSPRTARLP